MIEPGENRGIRWAGIGTEVRRVVLGERGLGMCTRLSNVSRQVGMSIMLSLLISGLEGCTTLDPFRVSQEVPGSPAQYVTISPVAVSNNLSTANSIDNSCGFQQSSAALGPLDVARLALCNNPTTHQSWANIEYAAAQVGLNAAAYIPTLDSNLSFSSGHTQQSVPQDVFLDQGDHLTSEQGLLQFNWVIYDGGARAANLDSARQQLIYYKATHDATLLSVFSSAIQQFFQVASAEAAVTAAKDAEAAALASEEVAEGRQRGGVGPISDVLQTLTALDQAKLNRIQVEGTLANQRGQLFVMIGLPPNGNVLLSPSRAPTPTISDLGEIDLLINQALKNHPSILAAEAYLKAQEAQVQVAEAQGTPVLSLTGSIGAGRFVGQISLPQKAYDLQDTWGIQLQIPLSAGVSRAYQIRQAEANVVGAQANVRSAELTVSQNVWANYQALRTDIVSLQSANDYVDVAQKSYSAASGRYQNGIASVLELIDAQTARANAQQQQIQVTSACLADRIKLTASIGVLDLSSIQ